MNRKTKSDELDRRNRSYGLRLAELTISRPGLLGFFLGHSRLESERLCSR